MPADGSTFRDMEEKWPHFKEEPHNHRIYTMWPIFVINNNIPPWLSIKREHIMLSMIIPGCIDENCFIYNVVVAPHLS